MSSDDNDLIELGNQIEDAVEVLRLASEAAIRLVDDDLEREDPGWPAMGTLVDKLDTINRLLAELPGDEISEAIKQARAYLDHISDLADGQSY